jgi:hypothetical protein
VDLAVGLERADEMLDEADLPQRDALDDIVGLPGWLVITKVLLAVMIAR